MMLHGKVRGGGEFNPFLPQDPELPELIPEDVLGTHWVTPAQQRHGKGLFSLSGMLTKECRFSPEG